MIEITTERLRAALHYDPETGIFTWLMRDNVPTHVNSRLAGKVAGCAREDSGGGIYWIIKIDGQSFRAHRLAILYMTGKLPDDLVDHRDLDGLNNRWCNLRVANNSQNAANAKLSRANTSGFKGVCFDKRRRRWKATVCLRGSNMHLGYHDTAEAACAAYYTASTAIHGKFARSS